MQDLGHCDVSSLQSPTAAQPRLQKQTRADVETR